MMTRFHLACDLSGCWLALTTTGTGLVGWAGMTRLLGNNNFATLQHDLAGNAGCFYKQRQRAFTDNASVVATRSGWLVSPAAGQRR